MDLLEVLAACGPAISALTVPTGGLEGDVRRRVRPAESFCEGDLVLVQPGDGATPNLCAQASRDSCAGVMVPLADPADWERHAASSGLALIRYGLEPRELGSRLDQILRPSAATTEPLEIRVGDLDRLAEALADRVGGPVILEDSQFRVLAYSSFTGDMDAGRSAAILGRQIPAEWMDTLRQTGALATLRTSSQVVDLYEGPWQAHRRLLVSVRSGSRVVGIIWVAEGDRPLPADARERMSRAAEAALPHFLHHDDEFRAERRRRGRFVMDLLESGSASSSRLAEVGLRRSAQLAVICISPAQMSMNARPDLIERVATHLSLTCEAFQWTAAVAWVAELSYAIVEVPDRADDGLHRIVQEVVTRSASVVPGGTVGGSSRPTRRLRSLPLRRSEAEDVVSLLRAKPALGTVGGYTQLQPHVLLHQTLATISEMADWRLGGLERLAQHDQEKQTDHVRSLLAYFGAGGNVTAAARSLDLHPTTLRYRLEQARRISEIDFNDHDVQLACELALRAQHGTGATRRDQS